MIPGLYIDDLLAYTEKRPGLSAYLPEMIDWLKVDRKWLCDIVYTLDTDAFRKYITECIEKKKKKKVDEAEKNMTNIATEFAEALKRSVVYSCKRV